MPTDLHYYDGNSASLHRGEAKNHRTADLSPGAFLPAILTSSSCYMCIAAIRTAGVPYLCISETRQRQSAISPRRTIIKAAAIRKRQCPAQPLRPCPGIESVYQNATLKLFHVSYLYQIFSYLNGIERSALAYLVAAEPECQSVLVGQVFSYTANIYVVLACCVERHGIN